MELIVGIVNSIPDATRMALHEGLPVVWSLLDLVGFDVWEDASISTPNGA